MAHEFVPDLVQYRVYSLYHLEPVDGWAMGISHETTMGIFTEAPGARVTLKAMPPIVLFPTVFESTPSAEKSVVKFASDAADKYEVVPPAPPIVPRQNSPWFFAAGFVIPLLSTMPWKLPAAVTADADAPE